MFCGNMNVSPLDAVFKPRPKALSDVDVMDTINPLVGRMVDGAVVVTEPRDFSVGGKLVGADSRAGLDVLQDVPLQGLALHVRDYAGHYVAAAFDHSKHYRLARRATAALAARTPSTDIGFVRFDVPAKRRIAVNLGHVFANFVSHAPSRLVSHAKLALEFLRWNAMPGRGEQIHGIEPFLERRARSLEGRSDHRMDVMTAPFARIGRLFGELVELGIAIALWTNRRVAVPQFHQVV